VHPFSQYINIIGKGKRAGRYLTVEQSYQAFKMILKQQAEPEQIGAFLMLLRVREESVEELAGFVKACREFTAPELQKINVDLDLGCYAGKRRHLPWFLLAVFCLAQAGKRVFLHGTKEPDSNRLYLPEVFSKLGLPICSSPSEVTDTIDKLNFAYLDLANVSPELEHLIQLRSLFGLRSPANTLARMLNPTQANFSFHGVFHRHFDERHAEVAKLLGDKQVACLRGEGGEVEVNPERAFDLYCCRDGVINIETFPELLPQRQIKPTELNPTELKSMWRGELEFEYGQQAVIGSLASYLMLMQLADDNQSALTLAQQMWQNRDKLWLDSIAR